MVNISFESKYLRKLSRFSYKPKDFWLHPEHQRNFVDYFQREYHISCEQDWKRVSLKLMATKGTKFTLIQSLGGMAVLRLHNYSIPSMLQHLYPEKNWFFAEIDPGSRAQASVMKFIQKAVVISKSSSIT